MTKIEKVSCKFITHNLNDDMHIQRAINFLLGRPSMIRVCVQRLKREMIFPIEYRVTVWYINRRDWNWDMFMAEHLKCGEIEVRP